MLKLFTTTTNTAHRICFSLTRIASRQLARFLDDKSGATAVEYGLIGVGISIAIVGIVYTIGNDISAFFAIIDSMIFSKVPS